MADAFISYNREDREIVMALASALEGFGFSVWWDADLLPGDSYPKVIAEIIRTSHAAIVIWSPKSVNSRWVIDEATRAAARKIIIPTSIGILPTDVPMGFGTIHIHNLDEWDLSAESPTIEPILQAVEKQVGRSRRIFALQTLDDSPHQPPLVDQEQSRAFSHWVKDFFWPLVYVAGLTLLLSTILIIVPAKVDPTIVAKELVRFVHIGAGMVILGGGFLLVVLFRIAARGATRLERLSTSIAAKKLAIHIWAPAAVAQPFVGLAMNYYKFGIFEWDRWTVLALVLYSAAILSWLTGFRAAWSAAQTDAMYGDASTVNIIQFQRDVLLGVALACTAGVYGLMIYRDEFRKLVEALGG